MNKTSVNIAKFKLIADVHKIPELRELFIKYLLTLGINDSEKESWKLAFTEALNNAIEHGSKSDPQKTVTVNWWNEEKTIWLEVADEGDGPCEERLKNPTLPEDPLAEGGRGLYIIHNFADHLEHWKANPGFKIRIGKSYTHLNNVLPENTEMESILEELSDCYESLSLYDQMAEKLISNDEIDQFVEFSLGLFMNSRDYDAITIEVREQHKTNKLEAIEKTSAYKALGELAPPSWDLLDEHDSLTWQTNKSNCPFSNASDFIKGACVPISAGGVNVALIAVAYKDDSKEILSNDINHLRVLADIVGVFFSQTIVKSERDIRKRLSTEIEIATKLQHRLLPVEQNPPQIEGYQLFIDSVSALEIAGDFVEVRKLNDSEYIGCVIDVMGKGISAAILAGIFRSQFIAFCNRNGSLHDFLNSTNIALETQLGNATMFITAFVFKLNIKEHTLTYSSAGHPPGLFMRQNKDTKLLLSTAPPMGLFKDVIYEENAIKLGEKDKVILITDGLYEWTDGSDIFGLDNMIDWFDKRQTKESALLWKAFKEKMQKAQKQAQIPQEDDETILILSRK